MTGFSEANLAVAVRESARIARNTHGLIVPHEIAEFVRADIERKGLHTSDLVDKAVKDFILKLILERRKPTPKADDPEQPFLFENLAMVFDVRHKVTRDDGSSVIQTIQKELGDFTLEDIDQVSAQKDENIEHAIEAKAEWDSAIRLVGPLLAQNPRWVWRDAVSYMRANGGL